MPIAQSSATVTGASARTRRRIRVSRRTVNHIVTANAASIDSWLSRPSSSWVTAATGRRSTAGQGPKYM